MLVIDKFFLQKDKEAATKILQTLIANSKIKNENSVVDTMLEHTNLNYLLDILFKRDLGFIVVEDEPSYHYVIFIDIGIFHLKVPLHDIYKIFPNVSKETVEAYYYYNDKNVNKICATTFYFFTNIPFKNWLDEHSIINETLESLPCYNAMQLSSLDIDDEEIEESNDSRYFNLYSSLKAKRLKEKEMKLKDSDDEEDVFYYNRIVKKEGIKNFLTYEIQRFPDLVEVYDDNRNEACSIILPTTADFEILKGLKKEKIVLPGFVVRDENSLYFTSCIGAETEAYRFDGVTFNQFYELESKLDLFHVFEGVRIMHEHQNLFFWSKDANPKYVNHIVSKENDYELGEIYEDKMIADIYTVIPFRYEDREIIKKEQCLENNFIVNNLITGLRFQENYEFGNENHNVRKYQDRIKRYDLGNVNVIICEDRHYNYYNKCPTEIIENSPVPVRLILACDADTHTAVLYLLNFCIKSFPTAYLDEVCRNDILIEIIPGYEHLEKGIAYSDELELPYMSLYSYLREKFQIFKAGLPRHLVISPNLDDEEMICEGKPAELKEKIHSKFTQIKSSILYAETLFEDEEELGKVIDPEVQSTLDVPFGIAIYDYAKTYISRQTLLLYADTFKDYLAERIDFAVVDLFYVELICLEDAAIQISNYSISKFISNYNVTPEEGKKGKRVNPNSVLDELDQIEEEYAKTMDLWDVQMNYSSSKIFLTKMREAFEIEQSIQRLNRNKEEISNIYKSKSSKLTGRFAIIISFVTIILTVIQVFQIYVDDYEAAEDGSQKTFFSIVEIILLRNLTMVDIIRIGLVAFLVVIVARFLISNYKNKILKKFKNKNR